MSCNRLRWPCRAAFAPGKLRAIGVSSLILLLAAGCQHTKPIRRCRFQPDRLGRGGEGSGGQCPRDAAFDDARRYSRLV